MKVLLAGYNLDADLISELGKNMPDGRELTPETVSAAYARISRNPLPVNELRKISRGEVASARQSNTRIVFDMGHSSIAEHAVFNVDALGVSRLIVEEIEKFRLCSYTEKSQRYVLLKDDFVVPEEVRAAGLQDPFVETVREQNQFYHVLYEALRPCVFEKHPDLAADPSNRVYLENLAKEDARYVLSLATQTQLGMTLNARNLELMLRRFSAHPLEEARRFGSQLYAACFGTAPSLVRYTEATEFDRGTRDELKDRTRELFAKWGKKKWEEKKPRIMAKRGHVSLIWATPDADRKLVAALLHSSSGHPMDKCIAVADLMDDREMEETIAASLKRMQSFDAPIREFEQVGLLYELIVSASCFAQLKRHRMATITTQEYDPALGITIPPAIREAGMEERFRKVLFRTEELYQQLEREAPGAGTYVLTNAHQKRVLMKVNAREMYHVARLRLDRHAQWDIRDTVEKMVSLGRRAMPFTLMLAAGKDGFAALRKSCFEEGEPGK
ncbi:MAG: FAD-dependent thymidylate synthase [Syntrophaceae bacterium]